jgi:hypothetical protein
VLRDGRIQVWDPANPGAGEDATAGAEHRQSSSANTSSTTTSMTRSRRPVSSPRTSSSRTRRVTTVREVGFSLLARRSV